MDSYRYNKRQIIICISNNRHYNFTNKDKYLAEILILLKEGFIIWNFMVKLFEQYRKWLKGRFDRKIISMMIGTGLLVTSSPFILNWIDVVLSFLKIANNLTGNKDSKDNTILAVCVGFVLIGIGLILLYFMKRKEKTKKHSLLQLNHSSIESAVYNNMDEVFSEYNIDVFPLNQAVEMKELSIPNLQHALREQEKTVEKVISRLNDVPNMEIAYLGLAHIPLVMLMGYQIADKAKCKLFEWNQNDFSWNSLREKSIYPPLFLIKEDTIQPIEETTEVIIRIGVTYPIPKTDLDGLNLEHLNSYYMHLETPRRNVIESIEQLNDYQKEFRLLLDEINQRYPKLEKIHLFYSGQPSLAYRLGSSISPRMDKDIWIYNNVKSAYPQYKWALKLGKVGDDYSPKIIEEGMTANV